MLRSVRYAMRCDCSLSVVNQRAASFHQVCVDGSILVSSILCHQCRGWHGSYPLRSTESSSCDNLNNQCQTNYYCVKIIDPMTDGVPYSTYKANCWNDDTLQITPNNSTFVANNMCFDFKDSEVPSNRFTYCFCNEEDYCNGSKEMIAALGALFIPLLYQF
uniref:Protein sleepless n=1 Tax=Heterorhabditis bacteriophora TaxID=37862 RepID=A0A1I7XBV3_HETBA